VRRAAYRDGIAWIALNDEPDDVDLDRVSGYISTLLLADLFAVDNEKVAADVVRYRVKHAKENA